MEKTSYKYEVIHDTLRDSPGVFSITILCELAGVSRSGYYAWIKAAPTREKREARDKADRHGGLYLHHDNHDPAGHEFSLHAPAGQEDFEASPGAGLCGFAERAGFCQQGGMVLPCRQPDVLQAVHRPRHRSKFCEGDHIICE